VLSVVSILPPPRTGQTLVTEAMVGLLQAQGALHLVAVRNETGARGARWTLRKHGRLLGGLIRAGLESRGRGHLYFVPDAAGGLWFNVVEAAVMRLLFRRVWFHHHVFSYTRARDGRMALIHRILGDRLHHIALAPIMAEGLEQHYGAARITVLNNTPFLSDMPEVPARTALRQVGFLGNITREKGIGLFLQTVAAAQAQAPGLVAVIAGPIGEAALRAEVEAFCAAAPETRRWIGPVQGQAKADFLAGTDLLLFPSRYANEALPMVIYEALAAGAPVLATARGCIPDQLAGTGWALEEDSFAEEAAARITTWAADPAGFAQASGQAAARFTAQREEAETALEEVMAEMAGPG